MWYEYCANTVHDHNCEAHMAPGANPYLNLTVRPQPLHTVRGT
jgi:hypothetical protein